jgi:acyl carrier protein
VKIRGFRIEPSEIEAVLKRHPRVRDAAVVLHGDASGEKRLVAYVADERLRLNATELRDFLKAKLPDYMLPAAIVVLKKFPLNSNGKIDRHALPEPGATSGEKVFVGPRDSVEAQLVAIWESALGMQPISVTDDFFQIGGHSLLAVRIFTEIERTLGKNLPLATLFQIPTIEKLAAALRQKGWKPAWQPIVVIQPSGSRPPFYSIATSRGVSERSNRFTACRRKGWTAAQSSTHQSKRWRNITSKRCAASSLTDRIISADILSAASWRLRWRSNSGRQASKWRSLPCSMLTTKGAVIPWPSGSDCGYALESSRRRTRS